MEEDCAGKTLNDLISGYARSCKPILYAFGPVYFVPRTSKNLKWHRRRWKRHARMLVEYKYKQKLFEAYIDEMSNKIKPEGFRDNFMCDVSEEDYDE